MASSRTIRLAKFARLAYEDNDFSTGDLVYQLQREGWSHSPALSDPSLKLQTYWSPLDRHLVVSFRGTVWSEPADRAAAAALWIGLEGTTQRFKGCLQFVEQVIAPAAAGYGQYQGASITLTGHSMGGSVAMFISYHTGLPAEVFNAYCSSIMVRNNDNRSTGLSYGAVILHIIQDDLLVGTSGFQMQGVRSVVYRAQQYSRGAHALVNWLYADLRVVSTGEVDCELTPPWQQRPDNDLLSAARQESAWVGGGVATTPQLTYFDAYSQTFSTHAAPYSQNEPGTGAAPGFVDFLTSTGRQLPPPPVVNLLPSTATRGMGPQFAPPQLFNAMPTAVMGLGRLIGAVTQTGLYHFELQVPRSSYADRGGNNPQWGGDDPRR